MVGRKLNDGQYYSLSVVASADHRNVKLTATSLVHPELSYTAKISLVELLEAAVGKGKGIDEMDAARLVADRLEVRAKKLVVAEPKSTSWSCVFA